MKMRVNLSLLLLFSTIAALLVNGEETGTCDASQGSCAASEAPAAKIAKGSNHEGKPPEVSFTDCSDRHAQCVGFQRQGECEKNPGWMIINCPRSCNACHLRDSKVRCDRNFLNISTTPIYAPGDMHDMFANIKTLYDARYGVEVVSESPWVVTFDHFLNDNEISALISTVEGTWEQSTDSGSVNEFGETGRTLSTGRTSSNAWCRAKCVNNPHVQTAIQKIEEITRIPRSHFESFQILRYMNGQKYNTHHDMSEAQSLRSSGPRILTFFLYLSDVEEGGETDFPDIKIRVTPKKGKAVLWPSTLNEDPNRQDGRTRHAALPVIKGIKYAANSWIHLYDFEKSNKWGCTGTFDYL